MWFIFVQLLGLIPSLIAITSLQSANRGRILTLQLLCCGMWILHYGILGAGTAVATNCIGILRALLCRYNDRPWAKSRLWLAVLMGLYLASAAVTWQGAPSALLTFSMLCTTVALWVHDMRVTRFLYLLNSRGASSQRDQPPKWAPITVKSGNISNIFFTLFGFELSYLESPVCTRTGSFFSLQISKILITFGLSTLKF